MILFIAIAIFLFELAILSSSAAHAQQSNREVTGLRTTSNGSIISDDDVSHSELKNTDSKVILAERVTKPSLWPLMGRLTDGFGNRHNPFHRRLSEFHPGQDIAAPRGTPVSVTAAGTVVFAGYKKGYGKTVIVDHGNNITTHYGHLSLIETTAGSLINGGERIGLAGSTGRSTGSHLHYEVRVNQIAVNTLPYLPATSQVIPLK